MLSGYFVPFSLIELSMENTAKAYGADIWDVYDRSSGMFSFFIFHNARLNDPELPNFCKKILKYSGDQSLDLIIADAIDVVGNSRNPKFMNLLIESVSHPSIQVREAVKEAMKKLSDLIATTPIPSNNIIIIVAKVIRKILYLARRYGDC